jgi:hypothetical protein
LQGLLLAAVFFGVGLVFRILGAGARFSMLGPGSNLVGLGARFLVDIFALIVLIPIMVIHIVAIVKAGQGEMWKLPIIGDIAERNA